MWLRPFRRFQLLPCTLDERDLTSSGKSIHSSLSWGLEPETGVVNGWLGVSNPYTMVQYVEFFMHFMFVGKLPAGHPLSMCDFCC